MSDTRDGRTEHVLTTIGSLALVIQLTVFQGTFGIVENPGVSGTVRGGLSGGLLLLAVSCFAGELYLRWKV